MAGERTLPGLGLTGFWDLGDDTWKPGMDANLIALSVIAGGWVASREAAAPGAPTQGDIVIADSDWGATVTNKSIQAYDNAAWVEVAPYEGLLMFDRATDELLRYDGAAWAVFSSGGGGGAGGGETIFVGARKPMPQVTPVTFATWVKATLSGATIDTHGFDGTNEFVVPAGVSRIRLTAAIRLTGGVSNNQWSFYKNGVALSSTDGNSVNEVDADNYSNGGQTMTSGAIDVVEGDTLDLRYYVASAAADLLGWLEIEAIEHEFSAPNMTAFVVAGEGSFLTSALSGTISTSAFAMKGNIWTNGFEDIVLKKATFNIDNDTEGATYVTQVGIVDVGDLVTEVLHTSAPWSSALLGNVTFDLGNVLIPASARFAVVLVRTDGTGVSPVQCTFPSSAPATLEQDGITFAVSVRLADNDMNIGDDLTYNSTTNVGCQLDFLTVDSAQAALDGLFNGVHKTGKFVRATPTVTQSISASTSTVVTLAQADPDIGGWWNGTNVLTVPAGVSHIDITAGWSVDASVGAIATETLLQLNGTTIAYSRTGVSAWGGDTISAGVVPVTAGDEIRLVVWSSLAITLRPSRTFLTAQAVRDSIVYTPPIRMLTRTADFSVTDSMLDGRTYVEVDTASAVVVTVPANLKGAGSLVVEGIGAGLVTFAAAGGVTVNSYTGLLALAGQHAVATLKPKGSDVFSLFGNLA